MSGGVCIQLEVLRSNSPSFWSSRYCSSDKISIPISEAMSRALFRGLCSFRDSQAARSKQRLRRPLGLSGEQSKKTYSSDFLSKATTSGSPPVFSISLSDHSFL